MPFLGRDWRSPGQHWVRDVSSKSEWLKMDSIRRKVLVDIHDETCTRKNIEILRRPLSDIRDNRDNETARPQPYVIIRQQQQLKTSLAEALVRVGVAEGVKDIRKVNYICKLMQELVKNQMTSLSGSAQKYTMRVIEQLVNNCISNDYSNKKAVNDLLLDLETTLKKGHYDHVGCASLWEEHVKRVDWFKKIFQPTNENSAESSQNKSGDDVNGGDNDDLAELSELENKLTLNDLPLEILHSVLTRLTNHEDLNSFVEAVFVRHELERQQQQNLFYKKLVLYHFPEKSKWLTILRMKESSLDELTWYELYMRLLRRYGPRETYADMLHLCKHCHALFWIGQGHPCFVNNVSPSSKPILPNLLADLFVG